MKGPLGRMSDGSRMANATESRAHRDRAAMMPARQNRRVAAEADHPAKAAAQPANKKGVLAGHEEEIARLYADGKGRRLSSIARTFGVSHTAIRKCLGLPRRASSKSRRWGKRYSQCCSCRAPIAVSGMATRGFCDRCTQRACEKITVFDRDKGVGAIPEALRRRYSLQG